MDDGKINELLNMLPEGYDDDFNNYLTITTILHAMISLMFGTNGARRTRPSTTLTKIGNFGNGASHYII
jgi:hypothetical protein